MQQPRPLSPACACRMAAATLCVLFPATLRAQSLDPIRQAASAAIPAALIAQAPPANPPVKPPPDKLSTAGQPKARTNAITVSGLIDFYYQYQFSNPTQGQKLTGRIYDVRHDTPTLSLAWVDIAMKPHPNGFGFLVSLAAGDSADNDVAAANSGKGESRYKNLAQIYGIYQAKSGLTADFGKFLSPYGYDTTKVILNYNYSLTDATFLVPNYEAGLRLAYPIKAINTIVSGYVVNSIYHTATSGLEEDNSHQDFILRANFTTRDGKFNYIIADGFGRDKLGTVGPGSGNEDVVLWDNWLTYNITRKTTLAGEYVYRKDSDEGGAYSLTGHGYGIYVRHQITPKYAVTLRSSGFSKNIASHIAPFTSTIFRADEITATLEDKVTARLTARLEYRHDNSSNPAAFGYVHGDNAAPRGFQDTLTLAGLYTF